MGMDEKMSALAFKTQLMGIRQTTSKSSIKCSYPVSNITTFIFGISRSQRSNLYIKSIDSPSKGDSIGFTNDDSMYLIDSTTLYNHSQFYCVEDKDLDNHECFTLSMVLNH